MLWAFFLLSFHREHHHDLQSLYFSYVQKMRSFEGQDLLGLLVSILVVGDFVVLQLKNVSKQGIS